MYSVIVDSLPVAEMLAKLSGGIVREVAEDVSADFRASWFADIGQLVYELGQEDCIIHEVDRPKWAQWVAFDLSGALWCYKDKPVLEKGEPRWGSRHKVYDMGHFAPESFRPHWRDSLIYIGDEVSNV